MIAAELRAQRIGSYMERREYASFCPAERILKGAISTPFIRVLNAVLIEEGVPQRKRLERLNSVAIRQMGILTQQEVLKINSEEI